MRVIYLAFDHLNFDYGLLKNADPKRDRILFIESQRMLKSRKWHFQRLFFLISSARHFAMNLEAKGFQVDYMKANSTREGILEFKKANGIPEVATIYPSSFRLTKELADVVSYFPNDFFLTTREDFSTWAKGQKKLLMENFYRNQRRRLNVLMKGDEPIGGKWNYDDENRKPLPSGHKFSPYLNHQLDEIDKSVIKELENSEFDLWGAKPDGSWGTTREAAIKQLDHFITKNLNKFGPHEDAMTTENWAVNHSLLSPYLNNGLLHPREVLEAVLKNQEEVHLASLASIEGFIRQLIGWREYINGIYWLFGDEYRNSNFWNGKGKLPPLFYDPDKTDMNCLSHIVREVSERSWVHHIPRLMVLSNFAQITGTSPQELLDWMRSVFIDATDWVMVPNVIGMSMNADGGKIMSKPYIAGGSYISKMSNYCDSCVFDPKLRVGEKACPFTTFYWNFIDNNYETLSKNQRISMQISGIKRIKDLDIIRIEAPTKLEQLRNGEL
jgi:deoxyribodipyrimidine photolyase-related protein